MRTRVRLPSSALMLAALLWPTTSMVGCAGPGATGPGDMGRGGSGQGGGGTTASSGGATGSGGRAAGSSGGTTGSSAGATGSNGGATGSGGRATGIGGRAGTGGATGSGGAPATGGRSGQGGGAGGSGGVTAGGGVEFFVAPTGNDSNPGTMALPFRTLNQGNAVAQPGATIWVMAGTFQYTPTMSLTKNGADGMPIRVWAFPGARPVLDFSGQTKGLSTARGIEISGNYWHLKGLEVENAGDNGIAISGSHNIVEDVILHGNGDTGLQITVSAAQATNNALGAFNLILNCDSYENLDQATGGENADGFAAKLRIGPGNIFRGCRAWNNADDGWDLFASDDVVVIDNCWAFLNGRPVAGTNPAGDGNGFKLGGAPSGPGEGGAVHQVTRSASFDNKACGFVRNNNPQLPTLSDCKVAANATDYCQLSCSPSTRMATTGAQAKLIARSADGSLPAIP